MVAVIFCIADSTLHRCVTVDQTLKLGFFAVASESLNDFSAFEDEDRWNCCDTVLHSEIHVLGDVDLSYFGFSVVIGSQLVNDWTQSLARASALGIEIDQYRSFRTEHIGFESIGCEFCRHVFSPVNGCPTWQSWVGSLYDVETVEFDGSNPRSTSVLSTHWTRRFYGFLFQ